MPAGPLQIFLYVGLFFALVAHFFEFLTYLKSSCIFVFCFSLLERFFEVWGGFGEGFSMILRCFFELFLKIATLRKIAFRLDRSDKIKGLRF